MRPTTSVYLDLLRFVAAAVVFFGHAYPQRLTGGLPGLWRFGSLGNDAVMVFFVLSGFVIAYVADRKERTLESYSISRLARLWSVVVPALVLTVAADAAGSWLAPALYAPNWFAADQPLWRIAANLLFVNELWFTSVRPFSNVPFWSLGYEFWYYAIFAAACYLASWRRVAALMAIGVIVGPKILLLLPVWLLGVGAYRWSIARPLAERAGGTLAVGSVACYIAFHVLDLPQRLDGVTVAWLGETLVDRLGYSKSFLGSYVIGILIALHLVGISAVSHRIAALLPARPIRYLASFTFSLYLFHYPLLFFFTAVLERTGTTAYRGPLVTAGTLAMVWALGTVTERRKSTVRRWLAAILGPRFRAAAGGGTGLKRKT
jgi:peptidoglycan/LPS O-acetylase OafA/YrhL